VSATGVRATRTVALPGPSDSPYWVYWMDAQQRRVVDEAVPLVGRPPNRVGYAVDHDARTFTVTLTWDAVPQEA
jgi:hypothetical protein